MLSPGLQFFQYLYQLVRYILLGLWLHSVFSMVFQNALGILRHCIFDSHHSFYGLGSSTLRNSMETMEPTSLGVGAWAFLSHGLEAVTKQLPICDRWMCLCCKAAPRKTKFRPKSLAPSTWILWDTWTLRASSSTTASTTFVMEQERLQRSLQQSY